MQRVCGDAATPRGDLHRIWMRGGYRPSGSGSGFGSPPQACGLDACTPRCLQKDDACKDDLLHHLLVPNDSSSNGKRSIPHMARGRLTRTIQMQRRSKCLPTSTTEAASVTPRPPHSLLTRLCSEGLQHLRGPCLKQEQSRCGTILCHECSLPASVTDILYAISGFFCTDDSSLQVSRTTGS